jgi:hypothetical protein
LTGIGADVARRGGRRIGFIIHYSYNTIVTAKSARGIQNRGLTI